MRFACTEEEFQVFEQVVEQDMLGSFTFYLELVLLGVKPGTCPAHRREVEVFRDEIEEMGLHVKRVKLEFVEFDELPDYAEELEYDKPYFVAREKEHLEVMKDKYEEGEKYEYRRDFGVFMGYPREDVEWFVKEGESQYEKSKQGLGDPGDYEEVNSTVMYIPEPTEESYERARKTAENYVQALREADEKFDSEVGEKLIKMQIEC